MQAENKRHVRVGSNLSKEKTQKIDATNLALMEDGEIADLLDYLVATCNPNFKPDISKLKTYSELVQLIVKIIQSKLYVSAGIGGLLVRKSENNEFQVLLYQRPKFPNIGKWSMPGGTIIHGDSIFSAIEKEYRNITGLRISQENSHILRITNHKEKDNGMDIHWLSPAYLIHVTLHIEKSLKELKNREYNNSKIIHELNSDIPREDWYVHPWEADLKNRKEEIFSSMETAILEYDNNNNTLEKSNLEVLKQHGEYYRLRWFKMKDISKSEEDQFTYPTIRAVESFNDREKLLADIIDETSKSLRKTIQDAVKELIPTDRT